MTLSKQQHEFGKDVSLLLSFLIVKGIKFTIGEVFRPQEMQDIYFRNNKTKTLNSKHKDKKAIDLNIWIDDNLCYEKEELQFIGDYWESLNTLNRWGGNWKRFQDTPHFERL